MKTKPEDFLGSLATLELPSGKVIYIEEIGRYGTQLTQIADVTWTHYDPSDNSVIDKPVYPAGTVTDPITNSFAGEYTHLVYVEIDQEDGTALRAELNRQNFDDDALELLPSKEEEYGRAAEESENANAKPWYEYVKPVAIVAGTIYVGNKLLNLKKKAA